jgi:uncharacterized membrane protein YidH (DUF202 family)
VTDPGRTGKPGNSPGGQGGPAGPDEPERSQPGLSRERTDLAWTRTAIAFAATGAAVLKNHLIAGLIVLSLGLVTWGVSRLLRAPADDESRPRRLLLVTILVTAVGMVALGVALTTPTSVR